MSTTAEKLTYLNTTKTLIKDNLNLGGANISNEPFRVYSSKLIDIYKDFLANGTDTLWNNWNKVNGTGESLTLNNTIQAKMKIELKGNTSQEGTPTPDSPQDIHVVSGDNEINICGKNLLPFTNQDFTLNGIRYYVQNGELYLNGTSSGETYRNNASFKNNFSFYLEAGTYVLKQNESSALSKYISTYNDNTQLAVINNNNTTSTFTLSEKTRVVLGFYVYQLTANNINLKLQLEKSSTATEYEEHKEQTYPINLGSIELCKIGDYQDSIVKDNGKWYLNKQIGKVVFDGSESWYQWGTDTFYITKLSSVRTGLSNYFKYNSTVTGASQLSNGEFFIHDSTNNNVVIFRNSSYTTVADFKTWLTTHNTEVYYPLSTPTYTEITDSTLISQLEAIKLSYDKQTNISQTNTDKPFILDVVALEELEI